MRLNLWEPVMESYNLVKLVSRKHCCRGQIKILVIEWQDSSCLLKVTVTNKLCLKHMTLRHLTCTNHLQYRTHSLTTATNVTQANGSFILFDKTDQQQKENKNKKDGRKTFSQLHTSTRKTFFALQANPKSKVKCKAFSDVRNPKKERQLQSFLHYTEIQNTHFLICILAAK